MRQVRQALSQQLLCRTIYRLQNNNTAAVESGTSCSTAGRTHSWRDCCCVMSCHLVGFVVAAVVFSTRKTKLGKYRFS